MPPIAPPLAFAGFMLSLIEITNTAAKMIPPSSGKRNLNTALCALVNNYRRKYQTQANAVMP